MSEEIVPIAVPGIHERFYVKFVELASKYDNPKILEIGAGHGAFTKKMYDAGYDVSANDIFPEYYRFDKVECIKADITEVMPYEDNSFDMIVAIEVMEHIHDHNIFFKECQRMLKPGGVVAVSTPNILSLKSRLRFLHSGFFYSFTPLEHERTDGLQHISSLTVDQYRNLGLTNKFKTVDIFIDRKQTTSILLSIFRPVMWVYCQIKKLPYSVHNKYTYIVGRVLFIVYTK